jgi:hypothetical protein
METRQMSLSKHFWGVATSLFTLLVGGWLMISPYALGFQTYGNPWVDQTKVAFWTGLGAAILSLVGVIAFTSTLVSDLRHAGIIKEAPKPEPVQIPAATPESRPAPDEFERAMTSLATVLAADLVEKRKKEAEKQAEIRNPEKTFARSQQ